MRGSKSWVRILASGLVRVAMIAALLHRIGLEYRYTNKEICFFSEDDYRD